MPGDRDRDRHLRSRVRIVARSSSSPRADVAWVRADISGVLQSVRSGPVFRAPGYRSRVPPCCIRPLVRFRRGCAFLSAAVRARVTASIMTMLS